MVPKDQLPLPGDGGSDSVAAHVERLRGKLGALRTIRTDTVGGTKVTPAKLEAFEVKHGLQLPPAYRAYLLACGDAGPGFPDGGFKKLAARKRMGQPFPLGEPWIEYDQELLDDYPDLDDLEGSPKEWMRALPPGARPDDGCLVLGASDDGCRYLLVLAGPRAGEVWVDGRAYGAGPVYPAGLGSDWSNWRAIPGAASEFLVVQERWLDRELASARLVARVVEAMGRGGPAEFVAELERGLDASTAAPASVRRQVREHVTSTLKAVLQEPEPDPDRCRDLADWLLAFEPGMSETLLAGRALAAASDYRAMLVLARAQQADVDVSVPLRACIDVHALVAELALGASNASLGPAIRADCGYFNGSPRPLVRALERTGALGRFADLAPGWLFFQFIVHAAHPSMDLVEKALDGVLAPFVSDPSHVSPNAAHFDALFDILRRTPASPERSRACAAFLGVFVYYETAVRAQGYRAEYVARLVEPLKDMGAIHEATTEAAGNIARAWLEPRREHLLSVARYYHLQALQRS